MKRSEERRAQLKSLAYDITGGIAMLMVFIVVLSGVTYWDNTFRCEARWASTAPAQYSVFGGCRVLMPDGRWIPEEQFRVVDFTEAAP